MQRAKSTRLISPPGLSFVAGARWARPPTTSYTSCQMAKVQFQKVRPPAPHLAKHTPTGYTRSYVYQMLIRIRIPYVYHRLLVFVWFLRVFYTEGWYVFSFSLRLKIFPRKGKRSRDNSRATRSLIALRSHASRVVGIGTRRERDREGASAGCGSAGRCWSRFGRFIERGTFSKRSSEV
jgi:hypothetical protein